jgi:ADP-ribose pyrophosphatase
MSHPQPWEQLDSQVVGDYGIFKVVRNRARSPRDGTVHEFHVLDVPPSVVIVPLTADGRVVLVEQYRHASGEVELEFPAGMMEPGEDPVDAGLRELEEETGWCAGAARRLGGFHADPAKQSTPVHMVVALECTAAGERHQDDGEDVHVRVVALDEIPALIRDGRMRSAAAITAWALYGLLADG